MKYFLVNGAVHAYESDGSQDAWIPEGAESITEQQAMDALRPSLEKRRASRWDQVKVERFRRTFGGAFVGGHWFHSDIDSRVQHMQLSRDADAIIAAGGSLSDQLSAGGNPVMWKTMANTFIPMTAGLAQSVVEAIKLLDALAFARAEALRAQIEASEDPESIDITTGWPSTYAVRNINTATYDELLDILGIGPVIAQAIVDGRPWASVDDLLTIPAVDQSLLDVLGPQLSV
ncbi:MAG: DUF4376 domain-containing protein [Ottowia sp.]|nr:DUF4376 domain-containing protein [Ottowia sp.]